MPEAIPKRVAVHTLGCKLNYAETTTIGRQFARAGYDVVGFGEPADIVVLNTCSVTERADRECRQLVRRALRTSPNAFVAVVGCYAQLQPEEIAGIDGVDLVAGTADKFDLLAHIGDARKNVRTEVVVRRISEAVNAHAATSVGADRTRAFLKVQDGCDYTCAFCTIPQARGASRSLGVSEVLSEARSLVESGYREAVLTGVNTGDYGRKNGTTLLALLKQLVQVDGLERIRVSSIEPNLLTDELLEYWINEPKLCKHWHMPLQSGSDSVLADMRRRYRSSWYADRVRMIADAVPDAGIGADVIVGFPGENDLHFRETEQFLSDLPVTYLHVFPYSERPGTLAIIMPGSIEPRIRTDRAERLRLLSVRKRRAFHESFAGKIVEVLVEGRSFDGEAVGLTDRYVKVHFPSSVDRTNERLQVEIVRAEDDACAGRLALHEEALVFQESGHAA
ncbi:MAG: tRNA (N(6)-L-threonylcarbamoyladenosine(37)-C(2))-methylthiotransferase MtaB [Ignavibacteria bacterium RIFCSPLOWO2_02_FULL_55_14]|nr:MAG: tRNA (N(6)-L-threonylcarbamoyladenosine(37)-C(2))-methylthiotransferase MtaB [Ignavibacteria bacterium RIFCSPLOWO2_02_FULL_55_14]OGU72285.1 MAG: tRNA (N(6)-L-threonylcarbamoyladenosine(37)-C(2))-methylthiotransferase MtaB [Ignavibacteria bacterium RIFCSPLOWO2_12_FULL_56_21]